MPMIEVNGLGLYHEVHGEGLSVLGIHGTPSSSAVWAPAAARLAAHGRCVLYDRRGFHRSARPEPFTTADLDDQVADAVGLLEALAAVPAVVIGRSTGGLIALALAQQHPEVVSALVLLEPALFTIDPEASLWAEHLRGVVLASEADEVSAGEAVIRAALGDETWDSLPGELRSVLAGSGPAVLAETRGRGLDLSAEPLRLSDQDLAGITQPTLVVAGEDSPEPLRRVTERLAERLPHAEHVRVPGGHLIDPAGPAVLAFIDRVSRPA